MFEEKQGGRSGWCRANEERRVEKPWGANYPQSRWTFQVLLVLPPGFRTNKAKLFIKTVIVSKSKLEKKIFPSTLTASNSTRQESSVTGSYSVEM